MNCLSVNIRGVGVDGKPGWIRKLKKDFGISFIGMQETMANDVQLGLVSSFWGGTDYDFVGANGNSGGILSIWDPKVFLKDSVTKDCNFLHVAGTILANSVRLNMLNVYAPQSNIEKRLLWSKIESLISSNQGWWILCGDFNAVRDRGERKNSKFDQVCARDFNDFIDVNGLREFNLKGLRFTYMSNRRGICTWSRIDRFLVCENVFNKWLNACVRALNRNLSDHSPLVFSVLDTNFGPKPFRMFDSWLDRPGCIDTINSVLENWVNWGPAVTNLLNKLKKLRGSLRNWYDSYRVKEKEDETWLRKEKEDLEIQMELKDLDETDLWIWSECLKEIEDIERHKTRDIRQKSRVKWAALGDENSSFFHNIVNDRKARNSIPGILICGDWVTKPALVKKEVLRFFRSHFKEQVPVWPTLVCDGLKKIKEQDGIELVATFSKQEIKDAVFGCGSNKAPGPDGFNFRFVKRFWNFFEEDFYNILGEFHETGIINTGCGSSFITLIPKVKTPLGLRDYRPITLIGMISKVITKILANRVKKVLGQVISEAQSAFLSDRFILDGPLMVNEILDLLKKRSRKPFMLKIDFEKAYDNVNWNFLISILTQMGFPPRWCDWIKGVYHSSRAAVLVNGSPTFNFRCEKGLRQGDPLSPFLFLIVMEALSWLLDKAKQIGVFKGICLSGDVADLSHLFYADDALILGEWSRDNLLSIARILRIFYLC
ncbi:putative RNA-directed DNA polymerase [Helianthus annuus]|nr:putative RNA-directed DNA polymerase [Helianthus annuus]KAJ0873255.1 putative RNA-directed DNA polymerase [Helianthus annuus]